jgi:TRAP-type C4-dicarboxylate transport system permease small subunit
MPFWFSAGRGIDWFLNRNRGPYKIGWLACLLALISVAYGALLVPMGLIDANPALRSPALNHAMSFAGGLWLIFGAITCCASFLQWRASRALRRAKKEAETQSQSSSDREEETASALR